MKTKPAKKAEKTIKLSEPVHTELKVMSAVKRMGITQYADMAILAQINKDKKKDGK